MAAYKKFSRYWDVQTESASTLAVIHLAWTKGPSKRIIKSVLTSYESKVGKTPDPSLRLASGSVGLG